MKKLLALLNTPVRAVIAVGLIILIAEFLIMAMIVSMHNIIFFDEVMEEIVAGIIDPILLIAIVSPVLYILIFRPMRNQQAELDVAHKKAESAFQEWMAALDVIDDPIFLHDKQFRILRCNKAYQQRAEIPFHEIIGQPYYEIFPKTGAPLPCCLRAMEKAEEEEEVIVGGVIYRSRAFAIKDEQGAYLYSVHTLEDITESRRAEAALIESEDKFRKIGESAQDGIIMMADKRILFWNAAAERIFGYTAAEALGQELHALIVPEPAHARFTQAFPHFQASGDGPIIGKMIEVTALHKGGEEFPVELSISATRLNGQWHAIGIVRDITKRKQAEQSLQQGEADLRALVEHSPIAMIVDVGVDTDEKITMMNQKFTELFGYTLEDVPDVRHWWPLAYPDEPYREALKAEWIGRVEKAIQSHCDIEPMETTVICKDGTIRQVRISLAYIGSRDIVTFEDFTERKRAESALRDREEQYRTMVESSNDMIWVLAPDGRFTFINKQAADVTGRSIEEWLGKTFEPIVLEDDLPMALEIHGKVMSGEKVHYEVRSKKTDGGILTLSVNSSPIFKGGKVSGTISFASDITERKQAEAQLIEQLEELRRWHEITSGREGRILVLKHEINELLVQAGQPPRYPSAELPNAE